MTEKKPETRSQQLNIRTTASLRAAIERAARDDGRSVTGYIERVLQKHLKEAGYLKR
jgi:hypothetical protein